MTQESAYSDVQTPRLVRTCLHSTPMAEASWQESLRLRLVERNHRESSFAPIIEQCTLPFDTSKIFNVSLICCFQPDRRLALQTKLLKERNAHLLGAANAVRGTGSTLGSGEE